MVGLAFYHPYASLLSNDCRKIHLAEADGNLYVGLFIATAIQMQKSLFSYKRKLGTKRANSLHIMLPSSEEGHPDYQFMESYIREMISNKQACYLSYLKRQFRILHPDTSLTGNTEASSILNPLSAKILDFYKEKMLCLSEKTDVLKTTIYMVSFLQKRLGLRGLNHQRL